MLGIKEYSDAELFAQPNLLGDMRTQAVQRGDYRTFYKDKLYYMTQFVALVINLRILDNNPKRARIVIELQDGKRLSFFAEVDKYIKENTIIEAIGICTKEESGFYHFQCRGGYRRIFTNEEILQLARGKKIDDLEITKVPWQIISSVRESDKINSLLYF